MKRFFFCLSLFILTAIPNLAQTILSLRSGFSHILNSGYGPNFSYSNQIQEKLFISSTVGIVFFSDDIPRYYRSQAHIENKAVLENAQTFSFGLKYFFGKEKFNPYLSAIWGLVRKKGKEYVNYTPGSEISSIQSRNVFDISAYAGFDFGTLIALNEKLSLDFDATVGYSKGGEIISFTGGIAYCL